MKILNQKLRLKALEKFAVRFGYVQKDVSFKFRDTKAWGVVLLGGDPTGYTQGGEVEQYEIMPEWSILNNGQRTYIIDQRNGRLVYGVKGTDLYRVLCELETGK